MLRLRPLNADAESWPIKCAGQTIGTKDEETDLSQLNLSGGDFEGAKIIGFKSINLDGADFSHANLRGVEIIADGGYGAAIISAIETNFSYAILIDTSWGAEWAGAYGEGELNFTDSNFDNADFTGATFSATKGGDDNIIGL